MYFWAINTQFECPNRGVSLPETCVTSLPSSLLLGSSEKVFWWVICDAWSRVLFPLRKAFIKITDFIATHSVTLNENEDTVLECQHMIWILYILAIGISVILSVSPYLVSYYFCCFFVNAVFWCLPESLIGSGH